MNEINQKTTIDTLLLNRLETLLSSITTKDSQLFDETTELIEMLLYTDNSAYKELLDYRKTLEKSLTSIISKNKVKANELSSKISSKIFLDTIQDKYEWLFRKDYLFKIIEIYSKRTILEYTKQETIEFEKVDEEEMYNYVDKIGSVGTENITENS